MRKNPNFHANLTEAELQAKVAELTIEIPEYREITNDDLPSEELLRGLLELRGKEVLLVYAWRNALRELPFMSYCKVEDVWGNRATEFTYSVVLAAISVQTYLSNREISYDIAKKAYFVRDNTALDAVTFYARKFAHNVASVYEAVCDDDGYASYTVEDSIQRDWGANPKLQQALVVQNVLDFNDLVKGKTVNQLNRNGIWKTEQLNVRGLLEWSSLYTGWQVLLKKLYKQFNSIGLAFLTEDLQHLYQGRRISDERMAVYIESLEYDEVLLNNAEELTAIFEGRVKTEANPRIRVMLVGPGGAGKTSLFQLLTQREAKQQNNATVAINTAEVDLAVHAEALPELEDVKLDMTLWDFGGQSVFYNLHRGFMRRNNCVYVLVVDSRHEQAPDDWLAQIKQYAASEHSDKESAKVLVVTNQYEKIHRKQNRQYLQREFKELVDPRDFFHLNCTDANEGFDQFLKALVAAATNSQKLITSDLVNGLGALSGVLANRDFIELHSLAKVFGMDSDSPEFLKEMSAFEDLGFIVRLDKDGHSTSESFCLKPQWITSTAYRAINHELLRKNGGRISLSKFKSEVLANEAEPEKIVEFLMMQKVVHSYFEGQNQRFLFFPDAAPAEEPQHIETLLNTANSEQSPVRLVTIEYPLQAFPMGLKSFAAVTLLEMKRDGVAGDAVQANAIAELAIWRDGVHVKFANGVNNEVDVIALYLINRQKVVLHCLYAKEGDNAESALAEPLYLFDCLINLEVPELAQEGGRKRPASSYKFKRTMPVLLAKPDEFSPEQRSAMFQHIAGYKKTEQEKGIVENDNNGRNGEPTVINNITTDTYVAGDLQQADFRKQNNTANQGGTVNAIQGDNAFQGDGTTQTIDHSQHQFSSISGSFNRTELPALSVPEKQFLLAALAQFREQRIRTFPEPHRPKLEKVVNEMCEVVESDTAQPQSAQTGKILKDMWGKVKNVKDMVEIVDLVQQGVYSLLGL